MKEFSSCKAAIDFCLEKQYFSVSHLYHDEKPMNMHIHDCYEVYFSISGGRQFLIDNRFYSIMPGDVFFINQYESHHLTQIDKAVHERIVLSIHPNYLKAVSSDATDLNACFAHRTGREPHKVTLSAERQKRFLYYVHKICNHHEYGEDLIEQSAFVELMVFLNRLFAESHIAASEAESASLEANSSQPGRIRAESEESAAAHLQVDNILTYINQNIQKPLTIDELSAQFFLSSSYLCRIFKAATGTTINKYITAKRITIAKSLLSEGYTVNEACERCGFHDYSNFLKAFTRAVGISPKKYSQFSGRA